MRLIVIVLQYPVEEIAADVRLFKAVKLISGIKNSPMGAVNLNLP
jgi:hypothetical protein